MATKVLILNVHSSRNAGDAALAFMTLELLKEHFFPLQAILSMDDPGSHQGEGVATGSLTTWLKSVSPEGKPRWNKSKLLWLLPATILPLLTYRLFGRPVNTLTPKALHGLIGAYIEADLVVSEAGGFLYHSGSGLTLLIAFYSLALAFVTGKPLYIFPQSIGPFKRKWECRLAKWVFTRARIVMARERISLKQIESCGVLSDKSVLIPDLAFSFPSAPANAAESWLSGQGIDLAKDRPLLGLTVINWGAQNTEFNLQSKYEAAIISSVKFFIETYGGKALFVPQVWGPLPVQDDRVPAQRIQASLMEYASHIHVIEEPLAPDLLKAVYGRMDMFIGSRMHSNIFALSEGVPVIAIAYQYKTEGIAQMLGLGEWVININQIDSPSLINLLSALCEKKDAIRKQLLANIPSIISQTRLAGQLVASDFMSLKQDR